MISYETYKILHVFTLMMVVSAMGFVLAEGRWVKNKSFKIITGLLSFLIFVGGMGLIARLGFKHGEPFPTWVMVKITSWFILCLSLVLLFKLSNPTHKILCFIGGGVAIFVAIFSAITKLA